MVVFVLCLPVGFCLSFLLFWGWCNMIFGFVIGFVLCLRVLGFRFRLGLVVGLCSLDFACFFCCLVCRFSEFVAGGGVIGVWVAGIYGGYGGLVGWFGY